MLEVQNLTKLYGEKKAVDNISFTVNRGEILGFLGPNGAGKSTTMNIITGYLSSTQGIVTIDGIDILAQPVKAKQKIGYLPEHPPLYLDMTVKEYLDFMFDLKKVKSPKKAHIAEICELVKITDVYGRIIKNLSKGYRQRVGLAQALLGSPDLLILDEPTVGLDPKQIIEIRNLIKQLGEKHTVILSSHILPEVQAVCERVIVINRGRLVADDTPDNLSRAMSTDHKLTVRVQGPQDGVYTLLQGLPNMLRVDKLGERESGGVFEYSIETENNTDVRREMFTRLADRGWPILGLRSSELSLEDIFLSLTSDDAAQGLAHAPDAETSAGTYEKLVAQDIASQLDGQPAQDDAADDESNGGEA